MLLIDVNNVNLMTVNMLKYIIASNQHCYQHINNILTTC